MCSGVSPAVRDVCNLGAECGSLHICSACTVYWAIGLIYVQAYTKDLGGKSLMSSLDLSKSSFYSHLRTQEKKCKRQITQGKTHTNILQAVKYVCSSATLIEIFSSRRSKLSLTVNKSSACSLKCTNLVSVHRQHGKKLLLQPVKHYNNTLPHDIWYRLSKTYLVVLVEKLGASFFVFFLISNVNLF